MIRHYSKEQFLTKFQLRYPWNNWKRILHRTDIHKSITATANKLSPPSQARGDVASAISIGFNGILSNFLSHKSLIVHKGKFYTIYGIVRCYAIYIISNQSYLYIHHRYVQNMKWENVDIIALSYSSWRLEDNELCLALYWVVNWEVYEGLEPQLSIAD